jgi:ATP-dependent Lon protease
MFNLNKKKLIEMSEEFDYPLLPLRDVVVFPNMVVPLFVGRDKSIKALEYAMSKDKEVFLSAQRDAKVDNPGVKDIFLFGTLGTVLQLLRLPDGTVKALIEGKRRAKIEDFVTHPDFFMVRVRKVEEDRPDAESLALARAISGGFDEYAKVNEKIGKDLAATVSAIEDPCRLADTIAAHLTMKIRDKQELLEMELLNPRLEMLFEKIRNEINIIRLENRLKKRVKKQMEKTQKDYYLNEQMRAIQKEMGTKDDFKAELADLEKKIKRKSSPRRPTQGPGRSSRN